MIKPRLGASLIIFISAYAPLAFLFAIRDFDTQLRWFAHPRFVFGSLTMAAFSVLLLLLVFRKLQGQFTATMTRVEIRSNDLMNYSIPYLISFFSVDFGKPQDILAFLLFMALLFVLTVKTHSIFINPVLAIWGYGLFAIEFEESGKAKSGIFLAKDTVKAGASYRVERLSQFLYLVTGTVEDKPV
jgi:hypothetical protein